MIDQQILSLAQAHHKVIAARLALTQAKTVQLKHEKDRTAYRLLWVKTYVCTPVVIICAAAVVGAAGFLAGVNSPDVAICKPANWGCTIRLKTPIYTKD